MTLGGASVDHTRMSKKRVQKRWLRIPPDCWIMISVSRSEFDTPSEKMRIPYLGNRYAEKTNEDLKIPILENVGSREEEIISREDMELEDFKPIATGLVACVFFMVLVLLYNAVNMCIDVQEHMTTYEPEIRVESVYVCPISIPNKTDVWVLRFDITNTNNHTLMCIYQFEASVFSSSSSSSSYNRTQSEELLATGGDFQRRCVEPLSHTSLNMTFTAEAPMNNSDWSNGLNNSDWSNGFDLKLHGGFDFDYLDAHIFKIGDVVCRDAKLAFLTSSSSSSNSSCGAMISDPPLCSYESYYYDE